MLKSSGAGGVVSIQQMRIMGLRAEKRCLRMTVICISSLHPYHPPPPPALRLVEG